MLNDRVLVRISDKAGERKSSGGIVIPATAQVAKRLIWATVVAQGQNVRSCEVGDKVLFSPEDRYEVEVQGEDYVMLRERELHAVAAERIEASTGLYLRPRTNASVRFWSGLGFSSRAPRSGRGMLDLSTWPVSPVRSRLGRSR